MHTACDTGYNFLRSEKSMGTGATDREFTSANLHCMLLRLSCRGGCNKAKTNPHGCVHEYVPRRVWVVNASVHLHKLTILLPCGRLTGDDNLLTQ